MGNAFDYVLTTPFDLRPVVEVEDEVYRGLMRLGFKPHREQPCVWGRFDLKLPADCGPSIERPVRALAWAGVVRLDRGGQPWDLQVLWRDEYTMGEDDWSGRRAPYAWHHETWRVPLEAGEAG